MALTSHLGSLMNTTMEQQAAYLLSWYAGRNRTVAALAERCARAKTERARTILQALAAQVAPAMFRPGVTSRW